MVTLSTSLGDITITLDFERTPLTAKNFLNYAEQSFYDGTIFHRVIDGFMIQGGGFDADMQQKPTETPIDNEAERASPNRIGSIAMARTSDPHSATAQFFINVANNDFLNYRSSSIDGWGYCVFGQVTAGMDVVDAIKAVATGTSHGHSDVPQEPILINKVTVETETVPE